MIKQVLMACAFVFTASIVFGQNTDSIVAEWIASAHADAQAEAFTHWNDDGEIPPACATCHAGAGFRDFYGLDGSAAGSIDVTIGIGGVVDCDTCHADGVSEIKEVLFPSGMPLAVAAGNATCSTCHQGRVGGARIEESTAGSDPDTVNPELRFMNPHYKAAASTQLGHLANGLYEYTGRDYVGPFDHAEGLNTCTSCHNPHSLEVVEFVCTECHGERPLVDIRARQVDWDGDGDVAVGVSVEVEALRMQLHDAIIAYARDVVEAPVIISGDAYPYFFIDTNANGEADAGEAIYPNRYASWTPRMLRAAYNYQFITKDHGAFAHNPHYALQALYDSIEDLGGDVSKLKRP